IKMGQGAIVGQVVPDSPAAKAKLETGDVILTLNNKPVVNPRNLQGIVEQLELGKGYPLEVLRDGKKQTLTVSVAEMPKSFTAAGIDDHEKVPGKESEVHKPTQFKDLGVEIQEVDSQLTEQLGYKGAVKGVLIAEVAADSPADSAGLKSGMVIEKVGTKVVTTVAEFTAAMKDLSIEKGILLLVRTPAGSRFVVVNKEV
ncbi:MAG: protease Do, partial [Planctomycetaceae bacterium]|nr:protease Do [Planctomycetaceae bacterium]